MYEKFFQTKQWLEYERKRQLVKTIVKTGEAHILTPKTALLLNDPQYAKKIHQTLSFNSSPYLPHPEIETIFDAADELERRNAKYQAINIFAHSAKFELDRYISPTFYERDILGKISEAIVETIVLAYKEEEEGEQLFSVAKKNFSGRLQAVQHEFYESYSDPHALSLKNRERYLGDLSRIPCSEDYFLDATFIRGGRLGDRYAGVEKIKEYVDLVGDELLPDELIKKGLGESLQRLKNEIGDTKMFFKKRVKAELKAIKLILDMLGKEVVDRLLRNGYVTVKGNDGGNYKIDIHGMVYSLPEEHGICLNVEEDMPRFDKILAKYLFLKASYEEDVKDIDIILEDERYWQEQEEKENRKIREEEEEKRRDASYDVNLNGRITGISLREQGEKIN
ncbi:MAG: hypothetical protein KKA79_03400 [Nanoarchaeota archaeon]|nr:hypothetical protein [Nanoarchaeota archaeon]